MLSVVNRLLHCPFITTQHQLSSVGLLKCKNRCFYGNSEQLQLLCGGVGIIRSGALKKLDVAELLICYTQYSDFSMRGQETLDPAYMNIGIFFRRTVTQIY